MTGDIVLCKDCDHCFALTAVDPMEPYSGGGDFYCSAFDMDFYSPSYNAETFYCADGVLREELRQ